MITFKDVYGVYKEAKGLAQYVTAGPEYVRSPVKGILNLHYRSAFAGNFGWYNGYSLYRVVFVINPDRISESIKYFKDIYSVPGGRSFAQDAGIQSDTFTLRICFDEEMMTTKDAGGQAALANKLLPLVPVGRALFQGASIVAGEVSSVLEGYPQHQENYKTQVQIVVDEIEKVLAMEDTFVTLSFGTLFTDKKFVVESLTKDYEKFTYDLKPTRVWVTLPLVEATPLFLGMSAQRLGWDDNGNA